MNAALYPATALSAAGNHEEFRIPDSPLGEAVCGFRLAWGWVDGTVQPCIIHEGVAYPGFRPATANEAYAR